MCLCCWFMPHCNISHFRFSHWPNMFCVTKVYAEVCFSSNKGGNIYKFTSKLTWFMYNQMSKLHSYMMLHGKTLGSHCVFKFKWLGLYLNFSTFFVKGDRGSTVVKMPCYKSEGRWFDSRWCHWNFYWHNPSDGTMALWLTQPLTEMSTRSISWG